MGNSETWKNLGFSGIGWVSILGFGSGSKKVRFLPWDFGFGYPSLLPTVIERELDVDTHILTNLEYLFGACSVLSYSMSPLITIPQIIGK